MLLLCGCGTTPSSASAGKSTTAPHQVDLSWDAPSSSPAEIVSYNVYRSLQGGSSFQRLNLSADTETVYLDTLVQSGASYTYFVTSVDGSGVESAPSNAVNVTIP